MSLGLVLAGEEHSAQDLVSTATLAEAAGFDFLFVSDHFHPWNTQQGHSSYLWSVLGAIATSTKSIRLFSAVTCPLFRIHPTTLAQAASTISILSDGRFCLGLGTGENLNEHVSGQGWPPYEQRRARLAEVIHLVRALWKGEEVDHAGEFFDVARATLFDPVEVPIYLAASGPKTVELAQELADGLICLGEDGELARRFEGPRFTQLSVCWGEDQSDCEQMAHRLWPEVALPGCTFSELETPADFARAAESVSRQDVAAAILCGPNPEPYRQKIQACFEVGFEGVALHQIGPEQSGFIDFCRRELFRIRPEQLPVPLSTADRYRQSGRGSPG